MFDGMKISILLIFKKQIYKNGSKESIFNKQKSCGLSLDWRQDFQ